MNPWIKKIIIILMVLIFTSNSYAGTLFRLIGIGQNQNDMDMILKEETKTYEAVKKAIKTGRIKKGLSQDLIQKRYGNPVLIMSESNNSEKWVYKPSYVSFFDNIKIYLFFNTSEKLTKITILGA